MKRIKKWAKRMLIGLLILLLLALITGFVYERVARAVTAKKFQPEGELIDVGGHKLHIVSKGTGTPTVVFESGLDIAGSLAWHAVHDSIAQFTQAVAYDRAGILWSERGKQPKTGAVIADDLYKLLKKSGHSGPYILVGHSLAGIILRPFLDKYRNEIVGLVLVDASHPYQLERFSPEANKTMKLPPSWLIKLGSEIGIIRFAGAGPLFNTEPSDSNNLIFQARAPMSMYGVADEIKHLEDLAKESQEFGKLDSLPLIVLTGNHPERYKQFSDSILGLQINGVWQDLQKDHLKLSTKSEQVMADKSIHYIQFEQPDLVIKAVRTLVESR